jgi:WD40 repeat protein
MIEGGLRMSACRILSLGTFLILGTAGTAAGLLAYHAHHDQPVGASQKGATPHVDKGNEKAATRPAAPQALAELKEASLVPRWENAAGHRGQQWLLAFSQDGKLAFFDQPSGRIIARDTTTWKQTGQLLINAKDLVTRQSGLAVTSPDGQLHAYSSRIGNADKDGWRITLEDTRTKAIVAQATNWTAPLLVFAPDGKTLFSADFKAIVLWEVPTLKKRRTFGPVNNEPRALVLSPDGHTLGVTCSHLGIEDQIWDLKTGKMKCGLGTHLAQVWSLAFAPDGKTLVSSGNDAQLKVWDTATGLTTLTIRLHPDSHNVVQKVIYSPSGKMVAVGEGTVVRLYDTATGKPGPVLRDHTSRINDLAFSPDGTQIASASGFVPSLITKLQRIDRQRERKPEPGEVIIWDLQAKKARHVLRPYTRQCTAIAWSPDGKQLLTGGLMEAGGHAEQGQLPQPSLFLWDTSTGKRIRSFAPGEAGVAQVMFNPDGKTIAHGGGGTLIRILDVQTGKQIHALRETQGATGFTFRKDGKVLAVVGGWGGVNMPNPGTMELWDPNTGARVARRTGHTTQINAVAFHPDGTAIATGGSDRAIWLWDIIPGRKK